MLPVSEAQLPVSRQPSAYLLLDLASLDTSADYSGLGIFRLKSCTCPSMSEPSNPDRTS